MGLIHKHKVLMDGIPAPEKWQNRLQAISCSLSPQAGPGAAPTCNWLITARSPAFPSRHPRLFWPHDAPPDRFLGPTLCHHSTWTPDVSSSYINFKITGRREMCLQHGLIWPDQNEGVGMWRSTLFFFFISSELNSNISSNFRVTTLQGLKKSFIEIMFIYNRI